MPELTDKELEEAVPEPTLKEVNTIVTEACELMSSSSYALSQLKYPGINRERRIMRIHFTDMLNARIDQEMIARLLDLEEERKEDAGT